MTTTDPTDPHDDDGNRLTPDWHPLSCGDYPAPRNCNDPYTPSPERNSPVQPVFTATARQNPLGAKPTISLYADRVEWRLKPEGFIKWLGYIITLGLAALFPLDKRKSIPLKSITNVEVDKANRWRAHVTVASRTFGTIKVRLRAEDAEAFLNHLSALSV